MRYYKIIENGYIPAIGTGPGGEEISAEEYNSIMALIQSKPAAEDGYDYKLKKDLTWELYELPPVEEVDEEATAEDYIAALVELGVEV